MFTLRRPSCTVELLKDIAARNNIAIPDHDIEGYLAVRRVCRGDGGCFA